MPKKTKKVAIVTQKKRRPRKSGKLMLKAHIRVDVPPTPSPDFLLEDTLDAQGPKRNPEETVALPRKRRSPFKSTLDYAEALEFDPTFTHAD
jgi:hypothetical protein